MPTRQQLELEMVRPQVGLDAYNPLTTPLSEREVSVSQISDWMKCRWMYWQKYDQGYQRSARAAAPTLGDAVHFGVALGLLERESSAPSVVRDAVHASLDVWVEDQMESVWGEHPMSQSESGDAEYIHQTLLDEFTDIAEAGKIIAWRALLDIDQREWETVRLADGTPLVEVRFQIEIATPAGPVTFGGTPDWVARHVPTRSVWLWDHKTRGNFQREESEQFNIQAVCYQHLLAMAGLPTVGSITNQIKSEVPKIPEMNKVWRNGKPAMSRARIATDWPTYRAALLQEGLDPSDYETEMKPKLDIRFFERLKAYRSTRTIQTTWEQVVLPNVWEMLSEHRSIHRSMGWMTCQFCEFQDPCQADLAGSDAAYILRTSYTTRSARWNAQPQVLDTPL